LGLQLLQLLLELVFFMLGVLFGKDAYNAGSNFLVDDCLVVFPMTLMPNPY
jgi:hypothetical protein